MLSKANIFFTIENEESITISFPCDAISIATKDEPP